MDKKELKQTYIEAQFFKTSFQKTIKWAISQIEKGVDNMDINILAGLEPNNYFEIKEYIEKILEEKLVITKEELEEWAGNFIIKLKKSFINKEIDIWNLDKKISQLCYKLDYPNWMVMLARNCEYSTDIEVFEKPFLDELDYITKLWSKYPEYSEFTKHYKREISNTHDYKETPSLLRRIISFLQLDHSC